MMKLVFELMLPEEPNISVLLTDVVKLADLMQQAHITRQENWDRKAFEEDVAQELKLRLHETAMFVSENVEQYRVILQDEKILPLIDSMLATYELLSGNRLVNRPRGH